MRGLCFFDGAGGIVERRRGGRPMGGRSDGADTDHSLPRKGPSSLAASPYPHPYSVNKISIINEMRHGCRSKFLILLELFAESSYQRSYRCFPGTFESSTPRIAPCAHWLRPLGRGNPCDDCAPFDNTTVGIDEDFPEGDPPIHPSCRCIISHVVDTSSITNTDNVMIPEGPGPEPEYDPKAVY